MIVDFYFPYSNQIRKAMHSVIIYFVEFSADIHVIRYCEYVWLSTDRQTNFWNLVCFFTFLTRFKIRKVMHLVPIYFVETTWDINVIRSSDSNWLPKTDRQPNQLLKLGVLFYFPYSNQDKKSSAFGLFCRVIDRYTRYQIIWVYLTTYRQTDRRTVESLSFFTFLI